MYLAGGANNWGNYHEDGSNFLSAFMPVFSGIRHGSVKLHNRIYVLKRHN